MRKLIILFFFVSFNAACSQYSSYEIIELDGIIQYEFSKDGSVYWLKSIWYTSDDGKIKSRMKPDYSSLVSIEQQCSDIVFKEKIKELETDDFRKETLFYSENYRDQSIRGNNPLHHGGDIYTLNDSTHVISFWVKGHGVIFKEICESYFSSEKLKSESSISCEYTEDKIELPLIVLIKYDTTYTLNQKQIGDLNLSDYKEKSLSIMWCE